MVFVDESSGTVEPLLGRETGTGVPRVDNRVIGCSQAHLLVCVMSNKTSFELAALQLALACCHSTLLLGPATGQALACNNLRRAHSVQGEDVALSSHLTEVMLHYYCLFRRVCT